MPAALIAHDLGRIGNRRWTLLLPAGGFLITCVGFCMVPDPAPRYLMPAYGPLALLAGVGMNRYLNQPHLPTRDHWLSMVGAGTALAAIALLVVDPFWLVALPIGLIAGAGSIAVTRGRWRFVLAAGLGPLLVHSALVWDLAIRSRHVRKAVEPAMAALRPLLPAELSFYGHVRTEALLLWWPRVRYDEFPTTPPTTRFVLGEEPFADPRSLHQLLARHGVRGVELARIALEDRALVLVEIRQPR
jgi:hypothetical protein